jgi:hypothetical protein
MPSKRLLDLKSVEARAALKEKESYENFELPYYFDFANLLAIASGVTYHKNLKELCKKRADSNESDSPRFYENVNYTVLSNKDGAFAWRPLELIHPILYMDLVNTITETQNWEMILRRFKSFAESCVKCISIPRISLGEDSNKASQVRYWWEEIEQRSIKMAMKYDYVFSTDITNCYGSIYTHSIEWALTDGGRNVVKQSMESTSRNGRQSLGAQIDKKIRNMNHGQTNGIPQGSILMDLIAEIVLGYSDLELTIALKDISRDEFQILRYRDDYRIFVNNPVTGYRILKELSNVLYGLGMKMNMAKTSESDDVISSSIKKEKLDVISIAPAKQHLQKEALRIYQLSKKYPNAGLIKRELSSYYDTISRLKSKEYENVDFEVLISIFAMIARTSPGTINWASAIISQLLSKIVTKNERERLVRDIHKKFESIPNTGIIDIWLQRISIVPGIDINYKDPLTEAALLKIKVSKLWECSWLNADVIKVLDSMNISNLKEEIDANNIPPIVSRKEVELFKQNYN